MGLLGEGFLRNVHRALGNGYIVTDDQESDHFKKNALKVLQKESQMLRQCDSQLPSTRFECGPGRERSPHVFSSSRRHERELPPHAASRINAIARRGIDAATGFIRGITKNGYAIVFKWTRT